MTTPLPARSIPSVSAVKASGGTIARRALTPMLFKSAAPALAASPITAANRLIQPMPDLSAGFAKMPSPPRTGQEARLTACRPCRFFCPGRDERG